MDPEFNERIQKQPIPKIYWDRREEENIQTRTFNVIRRTEKWLKDRKSRMGLHIASNEKLSQTPISSSDIIIDIAGAIDQKIKKVQTGRLKESLLGSSSIQVTCSKSKKKKREPAIEQTIIVLDPSEETQVTMDELVLDAPMTQDVDKGKKPEENPDSMTNLTIMTHLSIKHHKPKNLLVFLGG